MKYLNHGISKSKFQWHVYNYVRILLVLIADQLKKYIEPRNFVGKINVTLLQESRKAGHKLNYYYYYFNNYYCYYLKKSIAYIIIMILIILI